MNQRIKYQITEELKKHVSATLPNTSQIIWDKEIILSIFLINHIAFINQTKVQDLDEPHVTTTIYINCNDVFAWGCADAEAITNDELIDLYQEWLKDYYYGVDKWVCKKRNQQPQPPVKNKMKKAGVWDDDMEKLSPNTMDEMVQLGVKMLAAQHNKEKENVKKEEEL